MMAVLTSTAPTPITTESAPAEPHCACPATQTREHQHNLQQHDLQQRDHQQHDLPQHDLQQHGFEQREFQQNGFGQRDRQQNGFAQRDFQKNSFGQRDFQKNSFGQRDCQQNSFGQRDHQQNGFEQTDCQQNGFEQLDCQQNGLGQRDCQQDGFELNDFVENGHEKLDFHTCEFQENDHQQHDNRDQQQQEGQHPNDTDLSSVVGSQGFFRRSIQQKIQYRPCTKNQQCSILRINRNRCQYCRLKKCIAVGMSRDAVRFGRVPKREKARILAAMQQSSNSRSLEKAVAAELEDEQRLLATVVRAHLETCDFTRDKVEPMLARARDQPSYTACPPTLACPLNPNPQPLTGQQELLQDFSKRFSPAIRGVVEFAKRIPGFSLLAQDDQVTLLKAGVFEVLLVRLACMFDAHTSSMVCLNGQVLRRDSVHNSPNARFLMDSMFDFAERMNALRLTDAEVGLFCSVVVIAADRPGLRNTDLVERMHAKLRSALRSLMAQNRPGQPDACHDLMKKVPDLRTLNTLHSEKLLAFKMTEQQQQQQMQQQWSTSNATTTTTTTTSPGRIRREDDTKSPPGSSWSSGSDMALDEAKSPLGSVSSTESVCSTEHQGVVTATVPAPEYPGASSAPLLAATLAGSLCPHRHRANSGSSADDELVTAAHLVHNGLTITPVVRHTAPSLPAPAMHHPHHHPQQHHHSQHQPLASRSFRKLDSPSDSGIESGAETRPERLMVDGSAPTSLCSSPRSSLEDHPGDDKLTALGGVPPQSHHHHHHHSNSHHSVEDMPVLKRVLQAPPLYDTNSLMDEAYKPHKKFRALRNAKDSAEAEPAVVVSAPSAPAPAPGSLSSTHSTLAKSLMESPRMTAEQMKRTDIIHNYIMRGAESPTPAPQPASLLVCAPQSYVAQQASPQPHYGSAWPASYGTSVITTTNGSARAPQPAYVLVSSVQQHHQQQAPSLPQHSPQQQPSSVGGGEVTRIYYPHSPATSGPRSQPASPSSTQAKLVELQVEIADTQQPLNLSKKSPTPSPRLGGGVPLEV